MHGLSGKLKFSSAIHFTDQLCLQRGVLGLEWRRLHSVCAGQVQCATRINCVLGLRGGHVLFSIRGHGNRDVQRVSVKLQLRCGKRHFGELHLQRRRFRTGRRPVHIVCGGQVQDVTRNDLLLELYV